MKANDATDVARMDDDGGAVKQTASKGLSTLAVRLSGAYRGVLSGPIPGEREYGGPVQFRRLAAKSSQVGSGRAIPMSAATIADRQLEGGGVSSQRHPARDRFRWKAAWQRLHSLLTSRRAWQLIAVQRHG